ncbi:MAG: hypothetical protein JXR22_07170 [Prolixibacteraceae bacterium]|nr:hypothetical protein [Prolixibacteraceae bacterium]
MKCILLAIVILIGLMGRAQEHREMFRGGMFLHSGFVQNQLYFPAVKGMVSGIGGKITFRTGAHLRLGTEGYVSNYGYGDNEGQYKLGWGGLLAEYQMNENKIAPIFGITFGGGKIHDLYVTAGEFHDNLSDEAIYKVYASFIVAPHFSLEMRLSDHINLVGKVDYVFYPGINYSSFVAKGPRIYFGVLFMR